MHGFTKLFGTLITSTIWREDDKTRVVWITMLAMADKWGVVPASVPGLAAVANVETEDCRAALVRLSSPDADSRTKEREGRRIEEVDGGWRILNYAKYRAMGRGIDRTDYLREKQRESRARRQSMSTNVNQDQPISEAEAESRSGSERAATRQQPDLTPEREVSRVTPSPVTRDTSRSRVTDLTAGTDRKIAELRKVVPATPEQLAELRKKA